MKRMLLNFLFALALTMQARADLVKVEFSGTWSGYAGVAHPGDLFSGVISWDDSLPFSNTKEFTFSTIPAIQTILGPYFDLATDVHGIFEQFYTIPVPTFAVRCSPSTAFDGAARQYYLSVRPSGAQLNCQGMVATSPATATNYQYVMTSEAAVVVAHSPEPRYLGLLIGSALIGLVVKRRQNIRAVLNQ